MPASRSASKPAPIASLVTRSRATIPVGVDAELAYEVERAHPAGQLDDVGRVVDRHEAARPVLVLDQPGDVLVEHPPAEPRAGWRR